MCLSPRGDLAPAWPRPRMQSRRCCSEALSCLGSGVGVPPVGACCARSLGNCLDVSGPADDEEPVAGPQTDGDHEPFDGPRAAGIQRQFERLHELFVIRKERARHKYWLPNWRADRVPQIRQETGR